MEMESKDPNNKSIKRKSLLLSTYPSSSSSPSQEINSIHENELSIRLMGMNLETPLDDSECTSEILVSGTITMTCSVAQNFEAFMPVVATFLRLGEEIIVLYEKAKHNKELCGFLLKRCNCAMAAVRDLDMRKTENAEFFSKQENLDLFKNFIKCMDKIKKFISRVSKLHKLIKYFSASKIEEDFTLLINEFDGYMRNLNFSFTIQSRDELAKIKDYVSQMQELLFNIYGVSDDRQSQQNFLNGMDLVTGKNKKFQEQCKQNKILNPSEFEALEENEPLLDGSQYRRTNLCPSKRIEKRTSFKDCIDVSFKEFSITTSSLEQVDNEQTQIQTQVEIRRQVNILKELKNSDHIIRFFELGNQN